MSIDPTSTAGVRSLAPTERGESACSDYEHLVAVVQDLSLARSVGEIQEIVHRAARKLAHADGATFVLRQGDECYYADEDAIAPLWKGRRFPLTSCISGWAMLHRSAVVIADIYADARIPAEAYRPTFVQSLAMVPVRSNDPIAAIGAYWATRHEAGAAELRLLQALADCTSIAFENVALFEELRAARDAAESANRLKDEFLVNISHELRTPLNPILGWASLLLDGDLDAAGVREAATEIDKGARLELQHVDDLLDVSQIVSGRTHIEPVPVSAGEIIDAAVHAVTPAALAKGIVIQRDPDPGPIVLHADPQRLQQIAWNLLSNAVKFTTSGGVVRVRLERDAVHARLIVSDTGQGIPQPAMAHLFERFRQGDGTLRRAIGGRGLGLAMVRHLVELHGGRVYAESAGAGQGSTFTVELPLANASAAPRGAQFVERAAG